MAHRNVADRFWAKVDQTDPDGCWPWTASTFRARRGYGKFQAGTSRADARVVRAHRFAYELTNGPIPDGEMVCHACDNPPCCNPAHLFLGSASVNSADMVGKRRHGSHTGVRVDRKGSDHPNAKLTEDDVREIRRRAAQGEPHPSIAADFGVARGAVSDVVNRSWRHVQ